MTIRDNREYRNLGTFEVNNEDDGNVSYRVQGYASTFEEYKLFDDDGVEFFERISPDAFNDADMTDVVFLRDHEGRVLARTKNGTINLTVDNRGLFTDTDLGKTEAGRDMFEDVQVGNYSQMSFSFVVREDHFEESARKVVRVIDSIAKIYDVSAVAFPANPSTDIGVAYRSLFDGVIEKREAERLKAEHARKLLALKLKLNKGA
jgi:HK97 family phage prohead protease